MPVWVSHESDPQRETLVYALLDTQSDTSFILDSTCHALAVEGVRSELLLSTMSAKNQVIETSRIDGLRVRGHDSPGGGTQVQRGAAPSLRISRKKGSFFKTSACPRFCKRRVLFCTQVRSMGVKIPLQSTKYTRL